MIYLFKTLLTAIIIVSATEIAKRNTAMAAILLALPLMSVIAFSWMWVEGQSGQKIAAVASETFWYVIPTLPMFLALAWLLRHGVHFVLALALCAVMTVGLFYLTQHLLGKFLA